MSIPGGTEKLIRHETDQRLTNCATFTLTSLE